MYEVLFQSKSLLVYLEKYEANKLNTDLSDFYCPRMKYMIPSQSYNCTTQQLWNKRRKTQRGYIFPPGDCLNISMSLLTAYGNIYRCLITPKCLSCRQRADERLHALKQYMHSILHHSCGTVYTSRPNN